MPLTKDFKETVRERLQRDPKARKALLAEAIECLLSGDVDTGKAVLRDYINATIGFDELSDRTHTPTKSLMRMLGPKGNPQARNLFEVIAQLQRAEGLHFELSVKR
jgi:DNA-binding phage protein